MEDEFSGHDKQKIFFHLGESELALAERFVVALKDLTQPKQFDVSDRLMTFLERTFISRPIFVTIVGGRTRFSGLTPIGDTEMGRSYVIANDTPDGQYVLPSVVVKDVEGEVILPENYAARGISETFESTDSNVMQLTPGADFQHGGYHVGTSGVATLNHVVRFTPPGGGDAVILLADADNFTVTQGSPASAEASGPAEFGLPPQ